MGQFCLSPSDQVSMRSASARNLQYFTHVSVTGGGDLATYRPSWPDPSPRRWRRPKKVKGFPLIAAGSRKIFRSLLPVRQDVPELGPALKVWFHSTLLRTHRRAHYICRNAMYRTEANVTSSIFECQYFYAWRHTIFSVCLCMLTVLLKDMNSSIAFTH
jgi:hypothetical protein